MIRHVFMWSVAETADAEAVFDDLASLDRVVPGLRNWSVGRQLKADKSASAGDWQYILMADFESQADLAAYENHPAHVEIVERVFGDYKDWAVLDYEL